MTSPIRRPASQSVAPLSTQSQVAPAKKAPAAVAPLQLERARVSEWAGRTTWPKVGGATVQVQSQQKKLEVPLQGGGKGTVEWFDETLSLKNAKTGATVVLERADPRALTALAGELKGASAEDGPTGWDSSRSFSPVGSAGQLLSAREVVSSYTGGAHPNNGSQVRTYDARTGKQVKLDQLLTPEQFQRVVAGVKQGFEKLDEVDSYRPDNLSKAVRENFALVTDSKGKVHIEVLLPSYVHALGGSEAQFRFPAPDDAAFRARAGL